jgi:hypothetical protein
MAGSILIDYAASQAMTVTNLQGLAADNSTGYPLIGWTSASVNNTANEYHDYLVSGQFTTDNSASGRQAGFIYVYIVAALNDTPTWPAVASGTAWGTEGVASFTDTEERDGFARLLVTLAVDTTASCVVGFPPMSIAQLFGGTVPPYWCVFVSTNIYTSTTQALETVSGSSIWYTPVSARYT